MSTPLDLTDVPVLSFEPGPGLLPIDLDEMYRANTFIQGATRAGKSWMLRFLVEQLFGRVQQMLFDTEGEYASLTEKFDYALFSLKTPVQIVPANAPLLIRRLLDMGTSAIFDLSDLSTLDQQEFVRLAATELLRLTTNDPHRVLLVFDEVQRLSPNSGQGDASSTQALRELANRGLKRGLFLLAASQRHSSVDTAVRGAMTNLLVGGTPPGLDMKSAGEKLGFNVKEQRALGSLPRGEFFALGAMFDDLNAPRQVHRVRSGLVQTRHMDALEARTYAPPRASEALQALYEQLEDIPAQAEAEAHSLEELQAQVAGLQRALTSRPLGEERVVEKIVEVEKHVSVPVRVEVPVLGQEHVVQLRDIAEALTATGKDMLGTAQEILARLSTLPPPPNDAAKPNPNAAKPNPVPVLDPQRQQSTVPPIVGAPASYPSIPSPTTGEKTNSQQGEKMPIAERKILTVLAQYPTGRTKTQVAILAGYAIGGGGFGNALSALKTKGWREGDNASLRITEAGLRALGAWEPLPTGAALAEHWYRQLAKAERCVLQVLVDVHPRALTKADLAQRAGYEASGGGFGNALSRLRTLELIEGRAEMKAAAALFDG